MARIGTMRALLLILGRWGEKRLVPFIPSSKAESPKRENHDPHNYLKKAKVTPPFHYVEMGYGREKHSGWQKNSFWIREVRRWK